MIEVLKQALEAFEAIPEEIEGWIPDKCTDAVIAIKQAIAELESQEPVACGTYQEVTDTMNALWAGTLEQVQIAEEMKNKKLYTAPPQRTEKEPVAWIEGYPKAHYAEEWFIAKLNDGDRVVLQALPEEFKHDFTTRDGTYFLKESIKSWMQFPDTEFLPPPQRPWVGIEGEEIRNLWEEATKPDRSTMTMVTSFAKSIEAILKEKNT